MNDDNDTACLSDLLLDEWLSDELDPDIRSRVEAHLDACTTCRARLEVIETATTGFLSQAPTLSDHRALTRETRTSCRSVQRGRTVAVASSVLGLAAMVGLAVFTQRDDEQTRLKGSAHVDYFIKRGEHVKQGEREQHVRMGDQLRFVVSTPHAMHMALIDVDAEGSTVYLPHEGSESVAVSAGRKQPLDFGVELDNASGTERVYAVFCPAPFDVKAAAQALSRPQPVAPKDCTLDVITLHKEAL